MDYQHEADSPDAPMASIKESEIPQQLSELNHLVAEQGKIIEDLEERLSSVIGPREDSAKHGGPTLDLVPLAAEVREVANKVAGNNNHLMSIIRRVEL